MKLPISWLNEFVKINDTPILLAEKLASIGFEVESITNLGQDIKGVVVGKVININPHTNSDKLIVCLVDIGITILNIVTGDKSIKEGNFVPVAQNGASLPNNKIITTTEFKGTLSEGMLCSASELNINEDLYDGDCDNGIMILTSCKVGTDIREVFGLNDVILDVSITANRPDCQSIYGLAREIAALYQKPLAPLRTDYPCIDIKSKVLTVEINSEFCDVYMGQVVQDVNISKSDDIVRQRLTKVGLRPINNIVDITNYVLIELGQPMHAFDYDFVSSGIIIRQANALENISVLNGQEYKLNNTNQVIASKIKTLAIAGVIGGSDSAINKDTKSIFLESARFDRANVRNTARMLGIRTDSSARFEKGVSVGLQALGLSRALYLINKYKIGKILKDRVSVIKANIKPTVVKFDLNQINDLLGIKIPKEFVKKTLLHLDIKTMVVGQTFSATIPNHRDDIETYSDIAEEIIRFYGYDKLGSTLLKQSNFTKGDYSIKQDNLQHIRMTMCGYGYNEIMTYSFVNCNVVDKLLINNYTKEYNQIPLLNPISVEYGHMRTLMTSSMLNIIALNNSRRNKNYTLYELGKVYIKNVDIITQAEEIDKLCIGTVDSKANFYELKNVILKLLDDYNVQYSIKPSSSLEFVNPYVSLEIMSDDNVLGYIGEIHPLVLESFDINTKVIVAEINISGFIKNPLNINKYVEIPKYPVVFRDLAFVVEEDLQVATLIQNIKQYSKDLCNNIEIFDIYKGDQVPTGFKSVALKLTLQANMTLTDSTINEVIGNIVDGLNASGIARLRTNEL